MLLITIHSSTHQSHPTKLGLIGGVQFRLFAKLNLSFYKLTGCLFSLLEDTYNGSEVTKDLLLDTHGLFLLFVEPTAFYLSEGSHFKQVFGGVSFDFTEVIFAKRQVKTLLIVLLTSLELEFENVELFLTKKPRVHNKRVAKDFVCFI